MKKTFAVIIAAAGGAWLLAAPAQASDGCNPAALQFQEADGLGTTRVGAHKWADECFSAADTNGDGTIDPSEWGASIDNWFNSIDTNKDDKISADEFHQWEPGTAN